VRSIAKVGQKPIRERSLSTECSIARNEVALLVARAMVSNNR